MLAIIAAIENDFEREFILGIYKEYSRQMYESAYFIVHREDEAEEIVQEAFVKLIENVQRVMKLNAEIVPVYSITTAKHIAMNHLRTRSREDSHFKTVHIEDLDDFVEDSFAIPEDVYIHKEELRALARVFPNLPQDDKTVLEDKYILAMSDAEIAEELNIASSSVRCYLTRARRKAFALMKEQGF